MKTLPLFLTTLCMALTANARIGDTQAKVEERYGKPIQVYRDVKGRMGYIHRSDGYIILVQYIEGISQAENYSKENDAELTQAEIDTILAANAAGEKWQKYPKPITTNDGSVMQGWLTDRTHAMSVYGPSTINDKRYQHAISVNSRPYIEQNKALDERQNQR